MDDTQILSIIREFLDRKRLGKTAATLALELLEGNDQGQTIPISKVRPKNDSAEKPGTLRKANSYQPQSSLSNNFPSPISSSSSNLQSNKSGSIHSGNGIQHNNSGSNTNTNIRVGSDQYIRPKRVSTSTGHQRPGVSGTDDFHSSVPIHMAMSGLIPLPNQSLPGQFATSTSVPKKINDTSGENSPASPLVHGSSTSHSRRSRTSSLSEENRNLVILAPDLASASHSPVDPLQLQDPLQAVMTSPPLASPPITITDPEGNQSVNLEPLNSNISSGSSNNTHPNTNSHEIISSQKQRDIKVQPPVSFLVQTQQPSGGGTNIVENPEPAKNTPHQNGSKTTLLDPSDLSTNNTAINNNNDATSNQNPSSPSISSSGSSSVSSGAPLSSNQHNSHSHTGDNDLHQTGGGTTSGGAGSNSMSSSQTSLVSASVLSQQLYDGTGGASSSGGAGSNSVIVGSLQSAAGSSYHTTASGTNTPISDTEEDTDEYSDDDDLGYCRIAPGTISHNYLIQSCSVWANHTSHDPLTDDEDDDDEDEDSDDDSATSDDLSGSSDVDSVDDEAVPVPISKSSKSSIAVHTKPAKHHHHHQHHRQHNSQQGQQHHQHHVPSGHHNHKSSSTSSHTNAGTVPRKHSKSHHGAVFPMDDVELSPKMGQGKYKLRSRPLPPEGPQPALPMPSMSNIRPMNAPIVTPAAMIDPSSGIHSNHLKSPNPKSNSSDHHSNPNAPNIPLDFSIVNVKKSRHEKDVNLEYFNLKIVYDRQKTGFEATHEFPIRMGDVIAGRYEIVEYLGSAAFSRAVKCIDHMKGTTVCLKIIKNNKDYFDQSLDEIKLLTRIKQACNFQCDDFHVLELFDYFYFKEHLFLVCELLRENLYEVYKYNRQSGETIYFNIPRLQRVAWQCLIALNFIHSNNLIHCDLKPENILIKSYSRSLIKVIDFGSSCFTSDVLSSYVQSRSYRAPEVVLGCPVDAKIDIWSLGCILAELWTGRVLFQNESLVTLIAKHIGIIGLQKSDQQYLKEAPLADDIFTADGIIFEKKQNSNLEYIQIKKTSLKRRLQTTDPLFLSFVSFLLKINPKHRPTAWEAMHHPWFRHVYPDP